MITALDTETMLIEPGKLAPELVCVSTYDGHHEHLSHWTDGYKWPSGPIVGHNIAYDCAVLAAQYPELLRQIVDAYENDRITDTGIRQQLIDIANGDQHKYSLADLAKRHLGVTLDKDTWRLRYGEFRDLALTEWPEGARRYALDDAVTTWRVWEAQEADSKYLEDQYRQSRAAFFLHLMSAWGVTTDATAVNELKTKTETQYRDIETRLVAAGLKRPDRTLKSGEIREGARDTKAAMARLETAYEGRDCPRTPKGKASLSEDSCLRSNDPLLVEYATLASLRKTLSTDIPMLTPRLIQTRYSVLKETGRTGSSKPNIQNLPREGGVRECFVPRPGYVFAAADYAAMELHTLAQACITITGKSELAKALNAGRDPHLEMGARILGITYEDAKDRLASGDKRVKLARQASKAINFGLPGGLGAKRMVDYARTNYSVEMTLEDATKYKHVWLQQWPEMISYFKHINTVAEKGQLTHLFSRRYRGGIGFCDAANSYFQGLAADAAKSAGWLIMKACYLPGSILYGSRPVVFAHDEYIVEVPTEIGHECATELAWLMVEGAAPWLPNVRPKAEPCLMTRWSKDAKTAYENGRLVAAA